jgi:hypothetical protein
MSTELVRTRDDPVIRQVSLQDPVRQWLVNGVPVDLREDATSGDGEQRPQLLDVRGV